MSLLLKILQWILTSLRVKVTVFTVFKTPYHWNTKFHLTTLTLSPYALIYSCYWWAFGYFLILALFFVIDLITIWCSTYLAYWCIICFSPSSTPIISILEVRDLFLLFTVISSAPRTVPVLHSSSVNIFCWIYARPRLVMFTLGHTINAGGKWF